MSKDDQAIRLVSAQHLRVALFAIRLMLGIAQQYGIVRRQCCFFCTLQDLREERIGDVRHRDQDLGAALRLERPGDRVGNIAQRGRRLLDTRTRRWEHFLRARERTRYRPCRNAYVFGDVVDRCHISPGISGALHNASPDDPMLG